ncbi:terminase family protein [Candidatus Pacearchaeota archaeon]|nr:terminase family protein [Candidatus Pacearchaeota archaeon]
MFTIEELKNDEDLLFDTVDFLFNYKLYFYQTKFLMKCLNYRKIVGKWSRQSGKSQAVAIYILLMAILEKTTIIIAAPIQDQSNLMYSKIRELISENPDIQALLKKDTQSELIFNNRSVILSITCAHGGRTKRGHTCDILIIEEAGDMEDEVVGSVLIPYLASKGDKGQVIKIGTPLRRNHFYRSCYEDTNYEVINVTWRDAVKVGQYTQKFIDDEKAELTDVQFRCEYESEFVADAMGFFPPHILEKSELNYNLFEVL